MILVLEAEVGGVEFMLECTVRLCVKKCVRCENGIIFSLSEFHKGIVYW